MLLRELGLQHAVDENLEISLTHALQARSTGRVGATPMASEGPRDGSSLAVWTNGYAGGTATRRLELAGLALPLGAAKCLLDARVRTPATRTHPSTFHYVRAVPISKADRHAFELAVAGDASSPLLTDLAKAVVPYPENEHPALLATVCMYSEAGHDLERTIHALSLQQQDWSDTPLERARGSNTRMHVLAMCDGA